MAPKLLDRSMGPEMLDRYELIAELASGGMATVFLARLAGVGGFQRFVAIKRLHPHLNNEPDFVQMFLDEARLAASIHHPHVVPILEVGTSDAGFYVVMEYVEGDTLARLVARHTSDGQRFPAPVAARIALDTLAGLHAAHELTDDDGKPLGLVHRDVSPQNVLVGIDGSARLTDFGVARASSRLASTQSGTLKGKLAYMPPEQAKGDDQIDRRADVFAMGIVTWELLAGKRLFKGSTELETLNKLMFEAIPRLSTALPTASREIEDVLAKALERKPTSRFSTAADFADALERAAQASGGVATVRQVAEFVQATIGTEIQTSRSAVRAALAEPSQSKRSESLDALVGQGPASSARTKAPSTVRIPQAIPAPPGVVGPAQITLPSAQYDTPTKVTRESVSAPSGVAVSVPEPEISIDVDAAPRPASKAPIIAAVAILLLGVVGVGGYLALGRSKSDPSPTQPAASAPPPAATSSEKPAEKPPEAAPKTTKVETTSIDALPTEKTPSGPKSPPGAPPPKTTEKPKTADPPKPADPPPPPPKPTTDEYKNPYR